MKAITLLVLTSLLSISSFAQKKVSQKSLIGTWKMEIEIEEAFDEAKGELDEEDNLFGKILLSSVSGLVTGIMDEVEIYLAFEKNGVAQITVKAFDDIDTEQTHWHIDDKGRLIMEDTESFDTKDGYWVFVGDILVHKKFNEDDGDVDVYLVKID